MSKLVEIRRENGRAAIERAGGASKVAKKMGYSNPSFLVQQFGPNPTRSPSEGTMRKMEAAIGLEEGSLDIDPSAASTNSVSTELIATVIRSVGTAMAHEPIGALAPDKHAELIVLALADTLEHGGQPREEHARALVRLLR